jgi:hypothetical protein
MAALTDWARTLLEGRHYATLATQNADGSSHLTPVWYLFRDQQLFVGAPSFSRKVKTSRRDRRPRSSSIFGRPAPSVGSPEWARSRSCAAMSRGPSSRRFRSDTSRPPRLPIQEWARDSPAQMT